MVENVKTISAPPAAGARWVQHLLIDLSAIGAIAALAAAGIAPGTAAVTAIASIPIGYALQVRRKRASRSPLLAVAAGVLSAGAGAAIAGRETLERWFA